MHKVIILLIVITFNILQVNARNEIKNANDNLYTERNRLINNVATNIFKDKNGFLWIGSETGLSRYDGANFHNFQIIKSGLSDITSIFETDNDILWILTKQGKLAGFDKHKEMFIDPSSININLPATFESIYAYQNGLYALSNRKLYFISTKKEDNEIKIDITTPYIIEAAIVALYGSDNKLILKTQNDNLYIYNPVSKKTDCIDLAKIGLAKTEINNICITRNYIWICNVTTGLTCCDTQTQEVKNFDFNQGENLGNTNTNRHIIAIDDSRFVYHNNKCIYQLDFSYNNYLLAPMTSKEIMGFYENSIANNISNVYYDRKLSILWVASTNQGINKINLYNRNINTINLNNEIGSINNMIQDGQGYIWLATNKSGIYRSAEKEINTNLTFIPWNKKLSHSTSSMCKDKHGNLIIGNQSGKVYYVNSLTNQSDEIKILPLQLSGDTSPIIALYLSSKYDLWVITQKGIAVCNLNNKDYTTYNPFNPTIGKCTTIAEDAEGLIWVGTESGIKNAKIENGNILLEGNYERNHHLTPEKVLSIYINPSNRIYVSYPNKLLQINGSNKKIVTKKILYQDFPYGQIYGIIDDKNGTLWLGSNSGIITLCNKDAEVNTYPICGNEMYVTQLNDGNLLWANTQNHLTYFDPGKLKSQTIKQDILVSDIDINYERAEIGKEINNQTILTAPAYHTQNLSLNEDNNSLVVYLTDLQYNDLQRKISYRLLPNDTMWHDTYDYKIYLNRLKVGNHTLEIKQLTNDFKEEAYSILNIKIENDREISLWIILFALLILMGLCYICYSYYKDKIWRKRNISNINEGDSQKLKTLGICPKRENRFFELPNYAQIIANEDINSFLYSINDFLKEVIKTKNLSENISRKGKLALRSMINVKDACGQLINIYNPNIYNPTLKIGEYPVNEISYRIKKHFKELLNNSPITLLTEGDQLDEKIWIDREKIEFIIRNMLNNSFRHIAYVGKVWFSIKQISFNEKSYYVFTVSDKGKHINQNSDNANSNENNSAEIEIALSLMNILAKEHHGKIKLISDDTLGTQISLFILAGKEHFNNDSNVIFINQNQPLEKKKESNSLELKAVKEKDYVNEQVLATQDEIETNITKVVTTENNNIVSNGKPKLLIIEDHKDNRFYLKVLFSNEYTLFLAENGKEGLEIALKEIPDIIIADVMMPIMDGFECCRKIKEDLRTCHIPVILLTALIEDEEVVRGLENGADDYILKPFNPGILKTKVRRLVKSRSELKQIYKNLLTPQQKSKDAPSSLSSTKQVENPFIVQIMDIVSNNLQNPEFNVKKLSEMLNMSQPTLYRKVKQLTNFTIIELIRGVRLKHSAELLKNKTYNVQEVAEMVGYNDIPTFRKHFIDLYGVTPSAYTKE